jgi:hypothetical protein
MMNEFKVTANQAGALLGNLQASAESLKEMVRYEVDRALKGERDEVRRLKRRIEVLEGKGAKSGEMEVEVDVEGEEVVSEKVEGGSKED